MNVKNKPSLKSNGISRPFRDAVKQTLDEPHASDYTFLHGRGNRQLVVVCGTTLLDNQLCRSRSFLLRMSPIRYVVLDTLDMLCRQSSMCGQSNGYSTCYRQSEKRLQHSEYWQRSRSVNKVYICKRATKRKNPPCSMHDMLPHSQVKRTRRALVNSTRPPTARRPKRRPWSSPHRPTHPHVHPLPSYYVQPPPA